MSVRGFRWSPSSINTYLTCPYKFYLQYIEKTPQDHTKWTHYDTLGTSIHKVCEMFFRELMEPGALDKVSKPTEQFAEMLNRLYVRECSSLPLGLKADARDILHSFLRQTVNDFLEDKASFVPYAVEQHISTTHLDRPVYIIIDAIRRFDDGDELEDYKTSKSAQVSTEQIVQAATYVYFYQQVYKRTVKSFVFNFLRGPKRINLHITEDNIAYVLNEINDIQEATQSNSFPRHESWDNCKWCPVSMTCRKNKAKEMVEAAKTLLR